MKKQYLEIVLQKLPPHPAPMVKLEQYFTPANIAADILFSAYIEEDISDKVILDLGCGTGIFAIGAKLLGAREVLAVDIDSTGLVIGEGYAKALSLDINFLEGDINELEIGNFTENSIDTVFQNPPFGAQRSDKGADRIFLKQAISVGKTIYSLHLTKTEEFVELLIDKLGGSVLWKKTYLFPIGHAFSFHTKKIVNYNVTLFKIKA